MRGDVRRRGKTSKYIHVHVLYGFYVNLHVSASHLGLRLGDNGDTTNVTSEVAHAGGDVELGPSQRH